MPGLGQEPERTVKFTVEEFRNWQSKRATLLGMSGVGKTHISAMLRKQHWYHYSGDYRIGTRYLDESILDLIKEQVMQVPFISELLRNDWIYIRNNIKISDLGPVLSYVGKLGNPELGGVPLEDFQYRQARYRDAEKRIILWSGWSSQMALDPSMSVKRNVRRADMSPAILRTGFRW